MEFDRPVLRDPHAALTTGPLQWLFRKDQEGKVIAGVISASRDYVGRPKEDCLKEFEAQIKKVLPEAVDAKLLTGVIVIEKRATFAPLPGHRPLPPKPGPADQRNPKSLPGRRLHPNPLARHHGRRRPQRLPRRRSGHHKHRDKNQLPSLVSGPGFIEPMARAVIWPKISNCAPMDKNQLSVPGFVRAMLSPVGIECDTINP